MKKILIIDDEPDIRFLLKRVLMSHNYSVSEAESLKQAFELLTQFFFDIVILDINLPDGSGLEYARKFKNDKNILILISADNDQLKDNFKILGANGFLRKPFSPNELTSIIDEIQKTQPVNLNNLNI